MTTKSRSAVLSITPESIVEFRQKNSYRSARKSARTKVRPVTANDLLTGVVTPQSTRQTVPGHIITMETKDGEPEVLLPGDFIAEGKIGELHRITSDVMAKRTMVEVDPIDSRWAYYVDSSVRNVFQLTEPAYVQNPRGDQFNAAAGDWLVDMGDDWWIVERKQFADTHDLL